MANDSAWALGAQIASNNIAHRRARKEELEDEYRKSTAAGLHDQETNLLSRLGSPGLSDADKKKYNDDLINVRQSFNQLYHPVNAPGALQKDWGFLKGLITRKGKSAASPVAPPSDETVTVREQAISLPKEIGYEDPFAPPTKGHPLQRTGREPGQPADSIAFPPAQIRIPDTTKPRVALYKNLSPYERKLYDQREQATKEAQQMSAAGPLGQEEQARADIATQKIKVEETLRLAEQLGYSEDEIDSLRQSILEGVLGVAKKPALKLYTLPDGTTKMWLDANRPDLIPPGSTAVGGAAPKVGYKIDSATGQVVENATGKRFNYGDPNNPQDINAMFAGADKLTAMKQAFQEKMMGLRGVSYGTARQMAPINVLDTKNGNAPTMTTYLDMQKEPGRYLPAGEADKALAKENLMVDIARTSTLTRLAINNMKEDFPEDMKAKIVLAMRADDPHQALDNLLASGALGDLPDDQRDFLIATRQLAENAMAMRSILGAGQGSDDVRRAIHDTLPSLLTPDKKMALAQLTAFDGTLTSLHRGVPKVPLRNDLGGDQYIYITNGKRTIRGPKGTPIPPGWTLTNGPAAQ